MAETSIEWTHQAGTIGETWNPTTGCDKVSPGCGLPRFDGDDTGGCYALALAKRLKGMELGRAAKADTEEKRAAIMASAKYQTDGDPRTSGPGFGLAVHEGALHIPLRWDKPRTVFVNSMSDLGHARIPRDFLARVFATMAATPQHTYQILSKRPERMRRILADDAFVQQVEDHVDMLAADCEPYAYPAWPLSNVWIGTSVDLAKYLCRIDDLRATPAAVRFVSAEPLLGPLDGINLAGIDWLIAGGESGPGARPMDLGWVRDLRDRCAESGTAFFCKQLGAVWAQQANDPGKGNHWDAWPADLRIRQYPTTAEAVAA